MIKVCDVLKFLSDKFPLEDACDFDNVGLLAGDKDSDVTGILCCLDADTDAIDEALKVGANLVVTHHPVIFNGLKSVTAGDVVYKLIKSGVSVISMHTNFDVGVGGVNDILSSLLPIKNVKKFAASDGFLLNSAESEIEDPEEMADALKKILGCSVRYVGGRPIKNLLICSGSGGDFIEEVLDNGFDALITADVKHNRFIDAVNSNVSLFDAGHFSTERVCIRPLCEMLKGKFADIKCSVFETEKIKSN